MNYEIHPHIQLIDRHLFHELKPETNPHFPGNTCLFQNLIVIPATSSQTIPVAIKSHTRHDNQVNRIVIRVQFANRLQYAESLPGCRDSMPLNTRNSNTSPFTQGNRTVFFPAHLQT